MSCRLFFASLLLSAIVPVALHAQTKAPSEYDIQDSLKALASGRGSGPPGPGPDVERGKKITAVATQLDAFPAGGKKVQFATQLAELASKGDPGKEPMQAVTDTLSKALTETSGEGKKDKPSDSYMELARLVKYAGMTTEVTNPQLADAEAVLASHDADVQKADFTLPTLDGKKVTLSQLKGKIVLVNFFAVSCASCQQEMRDLNLIYGHYQSQGLVIMSISPEPLKEVGNMAGRLGVTYPIVFDTFRKAMEQFHIEQVPRTFVFDREGKLVAQSLDACTQGQFFRMLARAGLKPQ
jgi:peroxiredoxin